MPDHVHHPDRLNYPLKRKGDKGGGQWQQQTWDQALYELADKLSRLKDRYGAETLTFTHGTKRTYHWDCRRFFNLFGSPQYLRRKQYLHVPKLRHRVCHLRRHSHARGHGGRLHCHLRCQSGQFRSCGTLSPAGPGQKARR
nr:molybdopterin-dependent oxidoreductase [uncultured Desulfobacter sp.]